MQQLQWLSGCMKDKRKWFWLAMALAVVSAGLCVVFPFITQQITDRVLVGQTLPDGSVQRQTQLLVPLVCVMIGAQLLRSCVRYGMTASLEYVSQNVQQDIRRHLYDNLCTQDAGFYTRYRTGDLMTRLTGDLDMVRHTVCWISYNAVESTCLFLFSMTYLFSVNAALTLLLLAVAPVILACSFLFSRTVYPLYASLREKLSRMNSVAQENIAGNKTVRAFVREAYENEKFENCNEEYRQANLKANFHWLKFFPYIEGCAQLMGLLSVLFGGLFIIQGKMTAGDLAAFSLMSWGLSEPMRALGTYLNDFQRFLTSAAKVIEIYFARTRIENPEHGRTEGECRGSVEFRGVTVAYPHNSAPTLKDVSFSVTQGQTLAILGATGSGKTTLVDAVTRMLDVSGGTVLVDGVDVLFNTFAKSMAGIGAFVCGPRWLINLLRYNMRSQLYAKSLPMPMVIGALKRLDLIRKHPEYQEKLWEITRALQGGLKENGFEIGVTQSPVTPVYMKGGIPEATNLIVDLREKHNLFCSVVVYPVIPKGEIILRLIPTAAHTLDDVKFTIEAFKAIRNKLESGFYRDKPMPMKADEGFSVR